MTLYTSYWLGAELALVVLATHLRLPSRSLRLFIASAGLLHLATFTNPQPAEATAYECLCAVSLGSLAYAATKKSKRRMQRAQHTSNQMLYFIRSTAHAWW